MRIISGRVCAEEKNFNQTWEAVFFSSRGHVVLVKFFQLKHLSPLGALWPRLIYSNEGWLQYPVKAVLSNETTALYHNPATNSPKREEQRRSNRHLIPIRAAGVVMAFYLAYCPSTELWCLMLGWIQYLELNRWHWQKFLLRVLLCESKQNPSGIRHVFSLQRISGTHTSQPLPEFHFGLISHGLRKDGRKKFSSSLCTVG